jgi:HEAT repeat protein
MSGLDNPFKLTPATATQFVGRQDILLRWQERLTPDSEAWASGQSWLVIGSGGVGKTSLLNKMRQVAEDDFKAHVVSLDLGHYRQLDREGDFFHFLDIHLPPAQKWSSRLRHWFNLPADASTGQVATKFLSLLSHFAVAFSHVNWDGLGLEFSPPGVDSSQPSGFGLRLVKAFNTLASLSEEQDRPVVLLVDQVGKVHDAYRWLLVGYQLLQLAERIHHSKTSNIICVFSLRPERKGLLEYDLEYYLRAPLFKDAVYHMEHLHPFRQQEAITAVIERSKGKKGWGYLIAGKIARTLNASTGIDPYQVIVGAAAVWEHLYRGEEEKHPYELDDTAVYDIVRQGHGYLLESVRRRSATQWTVLSLLSFHPAGLTVDDITKQLNRRHKNLSLQEAEQAVAALSDQAGYRLLHMVSDANPALYMLAHDILREYLQRELPLKERMREQAQKLLDDGAWRYEYNLGAVPFNQQDLELLWQYRTQLSFSPMSWKAIAECELYIDKTRLLLWAAQYPEEIKTALTQIDRKRSKLLQEFRYLLLTAYLYPTSNSLSGLLSWVAQNAQSDGMRWQAAEALVQLGERNVTLSMLSELAQNGQDAGMRYQAAEALAKLGERGLALSVLSELAQNAQDEGMRYQATEALVKLGEREVPLSVLKDLAQNGQDDGIRQRATQALGQIGEPALSILRDLAQNAWDYLVRRQAIEALGQLGEQDVTLSVLRDLAQSDRDERVVRQRPAQAPRQLSVTALSRLAQHDQDDWTRQQAAKALMKLGERNIALTVLSELAQYAWDDKVRWWSTEALGQLGEPALSALSELAQNAQDDLLRRQATEALVKMGLPALLVLSELAQNAQDYWVRRQATEALVKLGEPALSALSELAQNAQDDWVRWQATEALVKLGELDVTLSVLSELAHDAQDYWVRRQATEILGQLGEQALVLSVLSELAQNAQDERGRWWAAEALMKLGKRDMTLPVLSELAQNAQDERVRWSAAEALMKLGKRDVALSVLSELARHARDDRVCRQAIEALGQFGEPALSVLSELAQNAQDDRVRRQATETLGQLGEPALSVLSELAQNAQDDRVRQRAAEALMKLGERDIPLSVLSEIAQNAQDERVRREIVETLRRHGKRDMALFVLFNVAWQGVGNIEIAAWDFVSILGTQIGDSQIGRHG